MWLTFLLFGWAWFGIVLGWFFTWLTYGYFVFLSALGFQLPVLPLVSFLLGRCTFEELRCMLKLIMIKLENYRKLGNIRKVIKQKWLNTKIVLLTRSWMILLKSRTLIMRKLETRIEILRLEIILFYKIICFQFRMMML